MRYVTLDEARDLPLWRRPVTLLFLMAGFLVMFAVTMIVQFTGYLLRNVANLIEPVDHDQDARDVLPPTNSITER